MKFNKLSQLFLVSAVGLVMAALLTACQIVTIDYVFVADSAGSSSGSAGQIETYAVDSQSGVLRTVAAAVSSGGTNPVAMAVSADYANLYVLNQGNNSVVHFSIASNGALTEKDSVTMATTPVSVAVDTAGTHLYVVSGTSSATLTEYALSSGTIGSVVATEALTLADYPDDTIIPTGVAVLANNSTVQGAAVFVTAYDKSVYNPGGTTTAGDTANPGWVFSFAIGSAGELTAATGSPYQAGVKPSAIATTPTDRFVYVTDWASNQMIGYSIQGGSRLSFLVNGPFTTGNEPTSITIDPRGQFIYVTNGLDSSVSGYSIDLATGSPTSAMAATAGSANGTDTQPVAVIVDPALGRFVFTANQLGNSVSGFRLNPDAGTLSANQATPYPSGANPTALVAVPHGNHSVQAVNP